jgi:hypothetical protein
MIGVDESALGVGGASRGIAIFWVTAARDSPFDRSACNNKNRILRKVKKKKKKAPGR